MHEIHVKGAFDAGFFAGIDNNSIADRNRLPFLHEKLNSFCAAFDVIPFQNADNDTLYSELVPQGVTHTLGKPTRIRIRDTSHFERWRTEALAFADIGTFSEYETSPAHRQTVRRLIEGCELVDLYFDVYRTGIIVAYLKIRVAGCAMRERLTVFECFEYAGYGEVLSRVPSPGINLFFDRIAAACREVFGNSEIGLLLKRDTRPRRKAAEVELFGFSGLILVSEAEAATLNFPIHASKPILFDYVDGDLYFNWWCSFFVQNEAVDVNHNVYHFLEYMDACWITLKVYQQLFVDLISRISDREAQSAEMLTQDQLTVLRSATSNIIFAADVFSYTDHQQISAVIKAMDAFGEFGRRGDKIDRQKEEFIQIITEYQQRTSERHSRHINMFLFFVSCVSVISLNISLFQYFRDTGIVTIVGREIEFGMAVPVVYLVGSTLAVLSLIGVAYRIFRPRY